MPPKPTCKVVKREGQTGARIAPKGCEVRTEVSAAGVKVRRNKAGSVKLKLKTAERSMSLIISSELGFPESAMTDLEEVVDPNDDYGKWCPFHNFTRRFRWHLFIYLLQNKKTTL